VPSNGSDWPNTWASPSVIEYRLQMTTEASTNAVITKAAMPRATGGRYIAPKPKVGPRGGDDRFRAAAAKAARKARQKQRKCK